MDGPSAIARLERQELDSAQTKFIGSLSAFALDRLPKYLRSRSNSVRSQLSSAQAVFLVFCTIFCVENDVSEKFVQSFVSKQFNC